MSPQRTYDVSRLVTAPTNADKAPAPDASPTRAAMSLEPCQEIEAELAGAVTGGIVCKLGWERADG